MQTFTMIEQPIKIKNLAFVAGDDFSFTVICPFDISTAVIDCSIGLTGLATYDFNKEVQLDGKTVILYMPKESSANLIDRMEWSFSITVGGVKRTYIKGVYNAL